jgi:ferrochelatase
MEQPVATQNTRTGVVLLQLGGPDGLESVEPFLYNLFCDPEIIDLPLAFVFRERLAKVISSRRSEHVREIYRKIGGKSPIRRLTERQAVALERALCKRLDVRVVVAMRYWHPLTEAAVEALVRENVHRVVLLPLYPQYSRSTTGSSVNEWRRVIRGTPLARIPTEVVDEYCDRRGYIEAVVRAVRIALNRVPAVDRNGVHLLFSAHGTPMRLVRSGDPYQAQVVRTYEAVIRAGAFGQPHSLCYQSKVGPQRWLRPSLTETIKRLGAEGVTHVIAVPVAFVSDHSETLFEINLDARKLALSRGIQHFDMSPALNTSPAFIRALAECVLEKVTP